MSVLTSDRAPSRSRLDHSTAPANLMFRDRPLTWLFVVATVCVDMIWLAELGPDDPALRMNSQPFKFLGFAGLGGILAQSTALALGLVFANSPILSRASLIVVGNTLLAYISYIAMGDAAEVWLAFFVLHASISVVIAMAVRLIQSFRSNQLCSHLWRVSLIELFGWTILVAILSYGYRFTDFASLDVEGCFIVLVPGIVFSLTAIWGLSNNSLWPSPIRVASPVLVSFTVIMLYDLLFGSSGMDEVAGLFGAIGVYLVFWIVIERADRGSDQREDEFQSC